MTKDTTKTPAADTQDRQAWMALLARADIKTLEGAWSALDDKPAYAVLRAPEVGMAMVRARAGGEGRQFNFGEMTLTRCVVQIDGGPLGHAYIAGRDKRHAMLAAVFDALLQTPERHAAIDAAVLQPTRQRLAGERKQTARKVAATRVDFFTMVRGHN